MFTLLGIAASFLDRHGAGQSAWRLEARRRVARQQPSGVMDHQLINGGSRDPVLGLENRKHPSGEMLIAIPAEFTQMRLDKDIVSQNQLALPSVLDQVSHAAHADGVAWMIKQPGVLQLRAESVERECRPGPRDLP